jgi:anti-sigma factor RsiW
MTHPEDLLADYVDGTLDERQRAVVDAHRVGCSSCGEEVAMARRALSALASLEDEPVPFGVTGPVLAEAGRRLEGRRTVLWERLQWAFGAAAAAALVLVVALNLGGGADPDQDAAREETTAVEAEAGAAATGAGESSLAFAFQGLERQEGVSTTTPGSWRSRGTPCRP